MLKKTATAALSAVCLAAINLKAAAPENHNIKTIHLIQDNAKDKMVSKLYTLKHIKATDIRPWISAAIKRFNSRSDIQRVNYNFGKKQFLLINTPPEMMKHVDNLIKIMDRPCKTDELGSIINSTGIARFYYPLKYREGSEILRLMKCTQISGDGSVYLNKSSNVIYWKDSVSDGSGAKNFISAIDRPRPQVQLEFKVYQIRESDLQDIGLDYLAWKNGPGFELFGIGMNSIDVFSNETLFNLVSNGMNPVIENFSGSWSGMFFAPAIDMSFIRLLSQKGKANIVNSARLNVCNDFSGSYHISLQPDYQNIAKTDQDMTEIISSTGSQYKVVIENPYINFKNHDDNDSTRSRAYNGSIPKLNDYTKTGGAMTFRYTINCSEIVEHNNYGAELSESSELSSTVTIELDKEKLLGSWGQNQLVKQTVGIPLLCEIPVLKYLFSTTTEVETVNKIFLTVKGKLVHPAHKFTETANNNFNEIK